MITFNTVDPNARASQVFIELQGKRRTVGGDTIPPIGLIVGQYDQAITGIVDNVPVQAFTADEVGSKFGFGSELHRQALWVFGYLGGFYNNMWFAPIAEPGAAVAGTGTIIFATNASSSGTYYFSIGGDLITFGVANGDTPTEIGDALVTAITANLNGSVTAANVTGTVTVTSKTKGVNANQIRLVINPSGITQETQNPSGTTVTLPGSGGYLTSGAGATDTHDVFFESDESEKLGDRFYTCISGPYTDTTNIGYYDDSWNARKDPSVKRPFDSFFGYVKETYSAIAAIPATINSEGISPIWEPRCLAPSWELQAYIMGVAMWSTTFDPGRPFKTLPVPIPFDSSIGDLSYAKNDALFRAGMGYLKIAGTDLVVGDLATSYRTNAVGAATSEWYDSISIHRRQQFLFDIENLFINEPYSRAILADDNTTTSKPYVIKPKKVIADLSLLVDSWSDQGWVKNADTIKASLKAEINATNNSRIDSEITVDEALALRIIGTLLNFLF